MTLSSFLDFFNGERGAVLRTCTQGTEELESEFSKSNLKYMRRFYLEYHETEPQIPQTLSGQLPAETLTETPIRQILSDQLPAVVPTETPIVQTLFAQLTYSFPLSWSYYILLITIDNREERRFYEIEFREKQWSLSELK